MLRRLPHLTLVALAAAALLASTALAAGGKPKHHKGSGSCSSAVCVYKEPQTTAGGAFNGGGGKPVPLGSARAQELAQLGGADAHALEVLATSRAFGVAGGPKSGTPNGFVSAPGAFLAALDLGPGPITLFVTLLAGAAAFGFGSALRRRRFHA